MLSYSIFRVAARREACMSQPKKVSMGQNCPLCLLPVPSREHVLKHFMDDLLELVAKNSPSPLKCHECNFTSDRPENVAKHVGLMHSRMDEMLQNEDLMKQKIAAYEGPMVMPREAEEAQPKVRKVAMKEI